MTDLKRRDDIIFRRLDDEWVVFDPEAVKIHTLNLTAALVWLHLTGEVDEDAIACSVADSFEHAVALEQVRPDVATAIRQFRDAGLLA